MSSSESGSRTSSDEAARDAVDLIGSVRWIRDPLVIAIICATVLLGGLYGTLYVYWGSGPVLVELPWYNPMMFTFLALTSLSVAFLAFGRYRVIGGPTSFWIGIGFSGLGIGLAFYVLAWPGLLPGGRSIIGQVPNTAAVISVLVPIMLGVPLLAAALAHWPGERELAGRRWLGVVAAWLAFVTLAYVTVVVSEQRLPVLVTPQGAFTVLLAAANALLLFLFVVGIVLSVRRYLLSADALLGYVALFQTAFAFSSLSNMIGDQRYDLWWYLNRVVLVSGSIAVLFGVLSEYVHLFRREQEKARQLQESDAHRQEFYRRTILAATDGKLVVSELKEIEEAVGPALMSWDVSSFDDLQAIYTSVKETALGTGLRGQDVNDFMSAVVELSTNAVKHAGGGRASLHRDGGSLFFVISDRGPGMGAMTIPDLALLKGYTTAGTLGMGYKFAIHFADRVYLATGPEGTTVAAEKALHAGPLDKLGPEQSDVPPWTE